MIENNNFDESMPTHGLRRDTNLFLTDSLALFDAFGDAVVAADPSGNVLNLNKIAENLTKWTHREAVGEPLDRILPIHSSVTGNPVPNPIQFLLGQSQTGYTSEYTTLINREGEKRQVYLKGAPIQSVSGAITGFVLILRDISEEHAIRENLRASEERYRNLAEMLPVGLFESDLALNLRFVNSEAMRMFQYSQDDLKTGLNALDMLSPESQEKAKEVRVRRFQGEHIPVVEYVFRRKDDSLFPGLLYMNQVSEHTGEYHGFRGVIIDITQRKKMENRLKYLSMHDALTKLYNRAFFEEEMQRLVRGNIPCLGIVVCDIDGLKLINETMGHRKGDELLKRAALILRKAFGHKQIIARIGGDEFAVLLRNSSPETIDNLCRKVRLEVDRHNSANPELHVSFSIGYAIDDKGKMDPAELFRIADSNMYHAKLYQSRNSRGDIVQALLQTLEDRNYVVQGHAERLQAHIHAVAEKLNLADGQRRDLEVLCRFHDLGKIGLQEKILMKPGPLSEEEHMEIREHCEIGYRIAMTVSDLAPIADFILKHHERWDGTGYPLGLKGDDIPLESRIIAIADAYDTLTHDRPYRKAVSHDEAVKILRDGAGTHFDPELVHIFLSVVDRS
jgi:diguanylate cyclase (GGDEF)-like protein/PAS domain S-box-containing protein